MERDGIKGMVKVVWDEAGTAHSVWGSIADSSDDFVVVVLQNGTQISLARSRVIKIEKPAEGCR
jgi:hypothetical protein